MTRARAWIGSAYIGFFGCVPQAGDDSVVGSEESSTGAEPAADSGDGATTTSGGDPDPDTGTESSGDGPAATGSSSGDETGREPGCIIEADPGSCDQPGYTGPGDCDPYAQDCPDGEKCLPYDPMGTGVWSSTRCSAVADDPAGLDEPCTMPDVSVGGEDTCDVGLVCWDLSGNNGVCAEMCGCGNLSPTCATPGTTCAAFRRGRRGRMPTAVRSPRPGRVRACADLRDQSGRAFSVPQRRR